MDNILKNNELTKTFLSVKSRRELAAFFSIKYEKFIYHLYKLPDSKKYTTFLIPKRSGDAREISSPISAIKIIQSKLNRVLQNIYEPKEIVHGFIFERNVVTNAKQHIKQKYVLNIDLENFFPSIHFGRVRGIFKVYPFNFNEEVANTLAHICCFNKRLPQGAPTSPVISNLICAKLDSEIMRLVKIHKCYYSRYADDLTFSTSIRKFPPCILELIKTDSSYVAKAGAELSKIIKENSFSINIKKTRLSHNYQRQEVTGLTVNEFTNVERKFVRQIRAMLNAWQKYELPAAEKEHFEKYNHRYRHMDRKPSFDDIVRGKINYLGMVRGKDDGIYINLCNKFNKLSINKKIKIPILEKTEGKYAIVMTEGKTDWKHLKSALTALGNKEYKLFSEIKFMEWGDGDKINNIELLNQCRSISQIPKDYIVIFMFDRDDETVLKNVMVKDQVFKKWPNNVYSFAIPVPSHRLENPEVSIELFYNDDEIKRKDSNGRRLFLNNEFSAKSGRHISENLFCRNHKTKRNTLCVIDANDEVFDPEDNNVALSKEDFAKNILNNIENFNNFNFDEFKKIFDIMQKIISS